jgi:hypothetical protein
VPAECRPVQGIILAVGNVGDVARVLIRAVGVLQSPSTVRAPSGELRPAAAKAGGVRPEFVVGSEIAAITCRCRIWTTASPAGIRAAAVADGLPVFEVAVGHDDRRRVGSARDDEHKRSYEKCRR